MRRVSLFFIISSLLLTGCSPTTKMREDPLIGKIFISENQKEISFDLMIGRMLEADVIYLGEKHDNADHHDHQMKIIKDLIAKGKKPRIGFETFSIDQTGALMAFVTGRKSGLTEKAKIMRENALRQELGFGHKPDKNWQFYFQIVQLAFDQNLNVFGADLPQGIIKRLTRSGKASLSPVERSFLKSSEFDDDAYKELMLEQFKAAHCGFGHVKMLENMYQTWLERNDAMAFSVVQTFKADPNEPVVLILGSGHVEFNMAVYERVDYLHKDIKQFNLGFVEITRSPSQLSDYFPQITKQNRTFPTPHEYIWITQRSSYEDPCIKFRNILKKMKKAHP